MLTHTVQCPTKVIRFSVAGKVTEQFHGFMLAASHFAQLACIGRIALAALSSHSECRTFLYVLHPGMFVPTAKVQNLRRHGQTHDISA